MIDNDEDDSFSFFFNGNKVEIVIRFWRIRGGSGGDLFYEIKVSVEVPIRRN